MKKLLLFISFFFIYYASFGQYWQQQVNYVIEATLNEKEKTINGFERIEYFNNSPDTLRFIWFHLWPNAYKNDKTAFSDQMLRNGSTDFYFSNKEERGYINRMDFKVNGASAKLEDHPEHIDIVKLVLPEPLAPSSKIVIATPFHVKLPFNFSRGGYDGNSFQLTQWYPKPAVYDSKGWHPMPYLDQGEFYSEFGNYDVRITVPKEYVVAATGNLQNQDELAWLKNRSSVPVQKKSPVSKTTGAKGTIKNPVESPMEVSADGMKTLQFLQNNVHDFAWFANKDFIVNYDTCKLSSGKVIDVFTYYTEKESSVWSGSVGLAKDAVRFYSNEVGEYPYNIVSAVQGPESFGGGMEYPTITIISPVESEKTLDLVLAHEIGHNWFYGILATNERTYPWMDEGINSFYEKKYIEQKYGEQTKESEILLQSLIKIRKDQPIATSSNDFTSLNYGAVAYHKTAVWLKLLEERVGKERFKQLMQTYYQQWQFKHPYPHDFVQVFSNASSNSSEIFALLDKTGTLPNNELRSSSVLSPLKPKSISEYLKNPKKNVFILSPAIGFNAYDKFMLGGLFSNYSLPQNKFQFVIIPLYAFGSKQLNGIGKFSFSTYPKTGLQKVELFVNGSKFTMNEFKDGLDRDHYSTFSKVSPGVEITFKNKNVHSTIRKFIQLRSYFINEEPFRIKFDSLITPTDTTIYTAVSKEDLKFNIHQVKLGIENNRILYPYSLQLTGQGSTEFTKLTVEGKYFFNYPKGGLHLRFFGGKMFYDSDKSYTYGYYIERFFLNMTGANGEEDYTYSNYFLGRNKFEGFMSKQIMMRDGGFKIRTDLNANKIGKTGDWLFALNLNTSFPDKLNPLSVLPIKIPIRLFADIGTYAEAWDEDAETDRFLFNAGFHLPLFNETINFYFPVIYSKPFNDYVKSIYPKNRIWNTMSFTISLNKTLTELKRQLPIE